MFVTFLCKLILFQLAVPSFSQLITYLTCSTNSDCLHFGLSLCDSGNCKPCSSNPDCAHLDPNSNCLTNSITTYCQVPCDDTKGADICGPVNSICYNDGTSSSCSSCSSAADCSTQYPTGVQCVSVNGIGYCGYCMIDSQCPDSHICKNLKCVQCSANSDCPTERPICSMTLKASTCMCLSDTDCPSSRPTCMQKTSNDPMTCYLLPTMQILHGDSPEKVILVFNKPMDPTSDIQDILTIQITDVSEYLYSYAITEIDSQTYELIFSINMDIPAPILTITIARPKQLPDNDGLVLSTTSYSLQLADLELLPSKHQRAIPVATDFTKYGTIVLLSASAVIAVLNSSTVTFWLIVYFMQTHYYLLYINAFYLTSITEPLDNFKIANFEVVPNIITILFESLGEDMANIKRNLLQDEVESSTFLFKIGRIVLVWAIVLACAVVLIVLSKIFKQYKGTSFVQKLKDTLVWSGALRVFFACYQEFTYASYKQLTEMSFDTTLLGMSSLLGLAGVIAAGVVPILTMPSLGKDSKSSAEKYTKGLGMLVHEYNTNLFIGRFYLTYSLLRRLATSLILIFLTSYPITTVVNILGLNILTIIILTYKPYKASRHNNLCIIMEAISIFSNILVLSLLIDLYGGEPDGEIRIWTCWEMVAALFLVLFFGFLFVVYEAFQAIFKYKKWLSEKRNGTQRATIHRAKRGDALRSINPYAENIERLNRSDIPFDSSSTLTLSKMGSSSDVTSQITFRGGSLHHDEGSKEGFVPLGTTLGSSIRASNRRSRIADSPQGRASYLQAPPPVYLQPQGTARTIRKRSTQEGSQFDLDLPWSPQKPSPKSPGIP